MKLLYAYFDDMEDERGNVRLCGPLKGVDLNFDSFMRFSFDLQNEKVRVSKGDPIPPCFFSYRGKDKINISAIIGENGSGKTSFSRLMYLWARGECGKAILIAEIDGRYKVWHRGCKKLKFLQDGNLKVEESVLEKLNAAISPVENVKLNETFFKFVYYSPFYNAMHQFQSEEPFFIDISTSNLIDRDGAMSYKESDAKNVWAFLLANRIDIRKTQLEDKNDNPEQDRPFIPRINGVDVAINLDRFREVGNKYKEVFDEYEKKSHGIQTRIKRYVPERNEHTYLTDKELFCRDVVELLASTEKVKAFFPKAFLAWQLMSWNDKGVGITSDPSGADEIMMRFCRECLMCPIATKQEVDTFRKQVTALIGGSMHLESSQSSALQDFSQCMLLFESNKTVARFDRVLQFDFRRSRKRYNSFILLVSAHARLKTIEDFLLIKSNPPMSSGEWAYLSTLARLYDTIKSIGEKPVVLFLDEIETTLHPLWQRSLVKILILFLETFFPSAAVHIVFASHSPMLLSDIPKSNVVFLMKDRDCYSVADMQHDLTRLGNTFGANICDLYESGYFLDEGPIGAFAKDKINSAITECSLWGFSNDCPKVVELIGDPIIRYYLERKVDAKTKNR